MSKIVQQALYNYIDPNKYQYFVVKSDYHAGIESFEVVASRRSYEDARKTAFAMYRNSTNKGPTTGFIAMTRQQAEIHQKNHKLKDPKELL